ncbi:hypothetical protein [Paenibacillus abyssi]|uniref:NACHT domain-containing protein n=1 Tax=Paenibacillus abyssi TaxID=1340531 RepID=A0A917CPB9_9BACL|nr:hypothetical protein [Paenibacillus abyssi]GGF93282.1 hypothetical protein GCM10010916_08300 [Paenibacillus abyssi]
MTGLDRHYFARGNTARGVHFLYDSAFQGLHKIFLLEGPQGTGKSTVISRLADEMMNQGFNVQLFHSPLNPETLDAMIIASLKIGFADGRTCEGLSSVKDVEIARIDFTQAVDDNPFSEQEQQEIESLRGQLLHAYSKAYDTFATALRIHDDLEDIYINKMDFHKADQIGQELAGSLFGNQTLNKEAVTRHLFFGAATPKGAVDHIQNLTAGLQRRIFIKGRPGSGKSTMLKRIAAAAAKRGFDVEIFHCGFDPNSLDMLTFPQLSAAIFDSTAPHEYFPDRTGDEILDMYEHVIEPGTDERYASELAPIQKQYSLKMKEAASYLAEAQEIDSRIRGYYTAVTDFSRIDRLYRQLFSEIDERIRQAQRSI